MFALTMVHDVDMRMCQHSVCERRTTLSSEWLLWLTLGRCFSCVVSKTRHCGSLWDWYTWWWDCECDMTTAV